MWDTIMYSNAKIINISLFISPMSNKPSEDKDVGDDDDDDDDEDDDDEDFGDDFYDQGHNVSKKEDGGTDDEQIEQSEHGEGINEIESTKEDSYNDLWFHRRAFNQIGVEFGHGLVSLHGHTDAVNCLACSIDGYFLVSGSKDGSIVLWKADSGLELYTIQNIGIEVSCIRFAANDDIILAGFNNGSIHIMKTKCGATYLVKT